MQVLVGARDRPGVDARALTLDVAGPVSPLVHEAHIGAGVHVRVDLLAPRRFARVAVEELDETAAPLVAALVGDQALRALWAGDSGRLVIEPSAGTPWLRVAAVDALDRWLHVPLDQALVDAERGVSRLRAAATLPTGSEAQQLVLGDALRLARNASTGVVRHLRRLARAGAPLPERLRSALDHLAADYAELATHVAGPDLQLAEVQRAWQALGDRRTAGTLVVRRRTRRTQRPHSPRPAVESPIDPRLVPARLLGVPADPGSAELYPSPEPTVGGAVRVEVPAFAGADVDESLAHRLLVRLVDRRTSDPLGHGLLTVVHGQRSTARHRFQATVPLAGRALTDVRADVYDVLKGAPPKLRDAGSSLREARCATMFLGEWRRLVALSRLSADRAALGERLRPLAERLRWVTANTSAPPFPGCPSVERLLGLIAEEGDLAHCLLEAGGDVGSGDDELGFASGVGRLLVAEVAAGGE
jgi:hypothetical protein